MNKDKPNYRIQHENPFHPYQWAVQKRFLWFFWRTVTLRDTHTPHNATDPRPGYYHCVDYVEERGGRL
jgi:hypothetical protein